MTPQLKEQWLAEVLREVMRAVMADEALQQALIFKGAWILNFQLGEDRYSKDIDSTAAPEWISRVRSLEEQQAFLQIHLERALKDHFEQQEPARFKLQKVSIERTPRSDHPRGWDMLRIRISIMDALFTVVRGLPPAELEVAAPESLGADSTEIRDFLGFPAQVYTLHRIAGEKLRAYLTSLPEYRRKMSGERAMRVKDLYDLARILQHRPADDADFWQKAGQEFVMACRSRYVDCAGPQTFKQDWDQARLRYEGDAHLNRIPFSEAEAALDLILEQLRRQGLFPQNHPLPDVASS